MTFLNRAESKRLEALAALANCNPFIPERVAYEKAALGSAYTDLGNTWHLNLDPRMINPNVDKIREQLPTFVGQLRDRLAQGADASPEQLLQYESLVRFHLYHQYDHEFNKLIERSEREELATRNVSSYQRYASEAASLLIIPGVELPVRSKPAHLFAWGFQIRRALNYIFSYLCGSSEAMAELRASVWESIFTHNPDRYRKFLYQRMGDIPTLIIGESGTGKEIVARAIGFSRYISFDENTERFSVDYASTFYPINLSALSPSLIESELFGHVKGSFTGASQNRPGIFETCGPLGTIFLDEIGELDPAIQVKLLRLLQTREFQRIGETKTRHFEGKIIAATHRDLGSAMDAEKFRSDFFYRIAGDVIETPSLRRQLQEEASDLKRMVHLLAERSLGSEDASHLADEALLWINENLGDSYTWPGNVRELEQCVRSILIRGRYNPPQRQKGQPDGSTLMDTFKSLDWSADDLLRNYCTAHYSKSRNYQDVARRLQLDRRTVKEKVDEALLASLDTP
jgi:DNA-binding NtrC family response regulator